MIKIISLLFVMSAGFSNDYLFECYEKGPGFGKYAAILCNGVKTQENLEAVLECYKKGPEDAKFATVLCSGVKTKKEVNELIDCYLKSPTVKGKFASVLCSKNGIGSQLVLKNL